MAGTETLRLPAFAGARNDLPAEQFDASDLAHAINVDISDTGKVSRRLGRVTQLVASGAHSIWSNGRVCLYGNATHLFSLDPTLTAATLLAVTGSAAPIVYTEHAARIYWANGDACGVVDETGKTSRSWGLNVPPMLAASPTGGELPLGRYGVTMTYVAADGQESGAPEMTLVDLPTGGGIQVFPVPSSDARVAAIRVYMTTANGDVLYHYGTLPPDTDMATLSIDTIELQAPLLTQFYGPPPAGSMIVAYRGRIYVARDNLVFPSAPFGPELFNLREYIHFPTAVRMLAAVEDGIYVSDSERTYFLGGQTPDTFVVRTVCESPSSFGQPAYAMGSEVFPEMPNDRVALWLGVDGPTVGLPGGTVRTLTGKYRYDLPARAGQAFFRRAQKPFQYIATFIGE